MTTLPIGALPGLLLSKMSERQFQNHVVKMAEARHWRCYHTFDSRRSQPGFPDLVMIKDGRLLFVELKTMRGRVTTDQTDWLSALGQAKNVLAYVWRPDVMDWIEQELSR